MKLNTRSPNRFDYFRNKNWKKIIKLFNQKGAIVHPTRFERKSLVQPTSLSSSIRYAMAERSGEFRSSHARRTRNKTIKVRQSISAVTSREQTRLNRARSSSRHHEACSAVLAPADHVYGDRRSWARRADSMTGARNLSADRGGGMGGEERRDTRKCGTLGPPFRDAVLVSIRIKPPPYSPLVILELVLAEDHSRWSFLKKEAIRLLSFLPTI